MSNIRANPYPGPRSFQKDEKLYGRQRETWELLNLLIAERIVLLSSPSGAGKTSLLQAALVPELLKEGFRVLPVMRPGLLPDAPAPGANRYVLSLLLGLESGRTLEGAPNSGAPTPASEQLPLAELGSMTLNAYLPRVWPIPQDDAWHGDVLIFDQFEEVLTADPSDRAAKAAFFAQVGEVLRDRNRWALFSMREEFVAALDPYLRPIPARFNISHRYRLDLLGPEAARQAMQGPAAAQHPPVVFSDAAARRLADDLRRVQVQLPDGSMDTTLGPFIEPVQLQVVCRRLWDNLAPDDFNIDVDDLAAVGDVDTALRGYYAGTMAHVAAATGLRERMLREWVDRQLITESGMRGQVLMGVGASQGLPNAAIWPLVTAHLVRAEQRRGATWFELAHDRLIAPVRGDNAAWFAEHLSTLQRQAALWRDQDKPDGLLLGGEMLAAAATWQAAQTSPLEPWETDFLAESSKAWEQTQKERRQNRLIRILAAAAAVVAAVAVAAAFFAYSQSLLAQQNAQTAQANAIKAQNNEKEAQRQAGIANTQSELAQKNAQEAVRQAEIATTQSQLALARELAAAAISNLNQDPELSLLLAMQAITPTYTMEGEDALRQALQAARLRQRFGGGDLPIAKIAFDPTGRQLAALGAASQVALWPVLAGEAAAATSPITGTGPLWAGAGISGVAGLALAYSPDGKLVATAHGDGSVRLWDAATGEMKTQLAAADPALAGRRDQVHSVVFSHDGRTLAAGGQDPAVRLWAVDALDAAPQELYSGAPEIFTLAFAPDDKSLALAGPDGMVHILDTATGDELQSWQAHDEAIYALDISHDDKHLATASQDKTAVIWDLAGDKPQKLQTLFDHTNSVADVRFSPNGACLATTSLDRTAKVWDAQTGQLLLKLPGLGDWGTAVAFDPAGAPGSAVATPAGAANSTPYRCGQWLAAASRDGVARLWAIGPNHEDTVFVGHAGPVETAVFSPDGAHVATGSDDGTARIWDAATGQEELALPALSARINQVAYSPDGTKLATAGWDGAARLYASQSGDLLATLQEPRSRRLQSVAFSPDGALLATAGENTRGKGTVVVWEVATGQPHNSWLYDRPMYGVAFSPAGDQLAVTGAGGQVYIYAAGSGDLLATLQHGAQPVYAAAFSPDGKTLATASWDNTAALWSLPAGELVQTLTGHSDRLYGVQFSPDGEMLATSSADHTIRLWDAGTGEVVRTLRGPEFNGLGFSPDGNTLVAGGEDGTARLFTLDVNDLLATAARRLTRTWTQEECLQYLHTAQCPAWRVR